MVLGGCAYMPFHKHKAYQPLPLPPMEKTAPVLANGQVYQPQNSVNWFSDHQPWRVGDVITVDIIENATASNAINNATSRKSSIGDAISSFFGLPLSFGSVGGAKVSPNITASSNNSSVGAGATTQSNSIVSTLAATVTKVLPNGNLELLGQTRINSGTGTGGQWLRISGIVRTEDISTYNTVPSTDVANAAVQYAGTGQGYEAARMPWLSRFFLSVWPF
jgi:flagellar L-ring protein precursor FlgH